MYWWHIEDLKTRLSAGPLPSRLAFQYGVIFIVCSSLVGLQQEGRHQDAWGVVNQIGGAIVAFLGTLWCYKANGGAQGRDFLDRYFSVSFVVAVRCMPAVLGLVLLWVTMHGIHGTQHTTGVEALGGLLVGGIYFWRTAFHIRSVSSGAMAKARPTGMRE